VFCLDALPDSRGIVTHFAEFCGFSLCPGMPLPERNRSVDPIASALLTHLVHEFHVPHELFYNSYFAMAQERVTLPRTEHHLNRVLGPWVKEANLTHPKLEPFRRVLLKRPAFSEPVGHDAAQKYLELLSVVLASTSKELQTLKEQPRRRVSDASAGRRSRPRGARRESRAARKSRSRE
jgi:hypothetical protein